jgi:hypothetical protein
MPRIRGRIRLRAALTALALLFAGIAVPATIASPAYADPCSVNANYWIPTGAPVIGDAISPWFYAPPNIAGGPRQIQFNAKSGEIFEKRNASCTLTGRKGFMYSSKYRVTECAKMGPVGPVGCTVSGWYWGNYKGCPSYYTQSNIQNYSRSGCNWYTGRVQVWNGG